MNTSENPPSQPVAQDFSIGSIAFDRFKILAELGSGAKGRVFKAQDMLLDKTVALKILLSGGNNERYILRFQTEARNISKMKHPNISMIYDFGIFGNTPFLSMEYIEGETLEELLKRSTTIPLPQFFEIFLQICAALDHAHVAGIVHRDIKPANIVISSQAGADLIVKVLDFGVAKNLEIIEEDDNSLTPIGNIVGSPNYMSPEQCDGQGVLTTASDNYSLGCVMWECLTGEPPLEGSSVMDTLSMHVHEQPRKLVDVIDVPEKLSDLIDSLLSKNPETRPDLKTIVIPLLEELRTECAQLFEEVDTASGDDDEPDSSTKQRSTKRFLVPFALLLLCLGAIVAIALVLGPNETENTKNYSRAFERTLHKQLSEPAGVNMDNMIDEINHGRTELNLMADLYSVGTLKKLRNLPGLLKLDLDDSKISDKEIVFLADIPNLEVLKMSRTEVRTLSGMDQVKNLRQIELKDTRVQDAALKNLVKLKNLNRVYLMNDDISDEGMMVLATLPALTELDVSHTQIKLDPSKPIKGFPKLEILSLESTNLDEAGLRKLLQSPSLMQVVLKKTRFFHSGSLRNEFPDLKFDDMNPVLFVLEEEYAYAGKTEQFELALAKLREMIDRSKKRFGRESIQANRYLPRLAALLVRLEKTEEAKITIARLLSIYKRTHDTDDLVGALNAQALTAVMSGDLKTSIALREKIVKVQEQKFGPESDNCVAALINLGDVYFTSHQLRRALKCYESAAKRVEKLQLDLPLHELSWIKVGDCNFVLRDLPAASKCYDRAIAVLGQRQGLNVQQANQLVAVYLNYAEIKLANAKRSEALEFTDKILKISKSDRIELKHLANLYKLRSRIFSALGKEKESKAALAECKRLQAELKLAN